MGSDGKPVKPVGSISGLVTVLAEIGKRRAARLEEMRKAVQENDVQAVFEHAKALCGLNNN